MVLANEVKLGVDTTQWCDMSGTFAEASWVRGMQRVGEDGDTNYLACRSVLSCAEKHSVGLLEPEISAADRHMTIVDQFYVEGLTGQDKDATLSCYLSRDPSM